MTKRYTHILLMADGGGFTPLWDLSEGWATDEIEPRELGLSSDLVQRLEAWFKVAEAGTLRAVEGIRDVESDDEITDFIAGGFHLAGDLQRELGHQTAVLYFRNSGQPQLPEVEVGDGNAYWSADRNEGEVKERRSRAGRRRRPKAGG